MISQASNSLFPELEPYSTGYLPVSATHSIYYEECGDPDGVPVVVLHGGPGSGCNPGQRRYFDPAYYRIVLFDQRGCGRSQPQGAIEENTTRHLADDMERLREHLGIQRWLIFGGSWGSALALFYTSIYIEHVQGLLLRGIFLASPDEINWFLYEARRFFPEAWEDFVSILSTGEREGILEAYSHRIFESQGAETVAAATHWNSYEAAIMRLLPDPPATTAANGEAMVNRLRVHLHYLINHCFLPQPLLSQIDKLRHVPAIIVHGRYDMVCPIQTAYALHRAWPEAEFHIVVDAGHAAAEPGTQAALVAASERFKNLIV